MTLFFQQPMSVLIKRILFGWKKGLDLFSILHFAKISGNISRGIIDFCSSDKKAKPDRSRRREQHSVYTVLFLDDI